MAVFGVPHKDWGETPVATIVLNKSAIANSTELLVWANKHLEARYQKIHQIFIVDELPRNVAGKVLKKDLQEKYLQNLEVEMRDVL